MKKAQVPFYLARPDSEVTKLMLSVAGFVAQEKNDNAPQYPNI